MSVDQRVAALLQQANEEAPGTVELARWVALAVRIEPHLLRRARLELAPNLDAGVESDLWFGPLVDARSASSIVLDRAVAAELREQLASASSLPGADTPLEAARRIVVQAHAYLAPALQLEEEVIYRALRGEPEDDQAIAAALERVLSAMRRDAPSASAVARWADRALLGMPARVRTLEPARELAAGTIMRLGQRTRLLRESDDIRLPSDGSWIAAHESRERVSLGVRLGPRALRFVDPTSELSASIELPDTTPRVVDVAWTDAAGAEHGRTVAAAVGKTVELPPGYASVTLRTIDGVEYELTAEAPATHAPEPHAPTAPALTYRVASVAVISDGRTNYPRLTPDVFEPPLPIRARHIEVGEDDGVTRTIVLTWTTASWPLPFVLRSVDAAVGFAPMEKYDTTAMARWWLIPVISVSVADWGTAPGKAQLEAVAEQLSWREDRSIDDRATYEAILPLLPGVTPVLGARVPYGDLPYAIRIHARLPERDVGEERARELARRAIAIAEAEGRVWHVAKDRGEESLIVSTAAVAQTLVALESRVRQLPWHAGLPALGATAPDDIAPQTFHTSQYDTPDVMRLVMAALVDEFIALGWVRRVHTEQAELLHFPTLFEPVDDVPFNSADAVKIATGSSDRSPFVYQELLLRLAAAGMTVMKAGGALAQLETRDGLCWIQELAEPARTELLVPRACPPAARQRIASTFLRAFGLVAGAVDARLDEGEMASAPPPTGLVFVSAAPADRGRELDRFLSEVAEEMHGLTGTRLDFYSDAHDREPGETWPRERDQAVSAAQIFVAIVTDAYLDSEWCAAELEHFVRRYEPSTAAGLLVPILWRGWPHRPLPPAIANRQAFDPKRYGVEDEGGFLGVVRRRDADLLATVVAAVAEAMVSALHEYPVPQHPEPHLGASNPDDQNASEAITPALDVGIVLTVLQALALAFHVRRLDGTAESDEARRSLYQLESETDVENYNHVRYQTEYLFTGPVRAYLVNGEVDPFEPTNEPPPAQDWFRQAPGNLVESDNLPQYVERLTTLWLKYSARATEKLELEWIDLTTLPLSALQAFRANFPDVAVQIGSEYRSKYAPKSAGGEDPEHWWSIRTDHYWEAVSRLREILLPALFAERERRGATTDPPPPP